MATRKQQREYADIIGVLSDMSKKDYRDAWRISHQYRKANKMLEKTLDRQEKQFMLPAKAKKESKSTNMGLNYETI